MTDNQRGALWIVLSCLAATIMSLAVRGLSGEVNALQITFARCAFGLLLILPLVRRPGFGSLISRQWKLQLLRALLLVVAVYCGFYVLTVLPLATATVLFFTAPLFVTLLAGPLLGETVGWRRWTATGVGFFGTLVVMRPGAAGLDPAMLVAIASAFCFALALLLGKRLSLSDPPGTMLLYFGVIGTLASIPPAVVVWRAPSAFEWGLLLVVALFSTARTYCDIRGYAAGEASSVAPFQYLRIVTIGLSAFLLFGEVPTSAALLGAGVIIASTLYIARREATLRKGTRRLETT